MQRGMSYGRIQTPSARDAAQHKLSGAKNQTPPTCYAAGHELREAWATIRFRCHQLRGMSYNKIQVPSAHDAAQHKLSKAKNQTPPTCYVAGHELQ
eukprot:1161047-Pelagomonas_calceolata.AAC.25